MNVVGPVLLTALVAAAVGAVFKFLPWAMTARIRELANEEIDKREERRKPTQRVMRNDDASA